MKRYILEVVVFISGAVVMIFELAGSRVLAPYVGTSLFVWTSLIGIVLGSLSVGYWLGGKIADKKASPEILSLILLAAAILFGLIAVTKDYILILLYNSITDIRWNSVISSGILFAMPSILLGMVSPYAVKLKMKSLRTSASTVGNLYAISTVGSIVGTFLTGFVLIPLLGNTKILFLLSCILIFVSLLLFFSKYKKTRFSLLIIFLIATFTFNPVSLLLGKSNMIDIDTQYNRVWLFDEMDITTGENVRHMRIDNKSSSDMFLESDELVYEYLKYYHLAKHFNPNFQTTLMLGGAAYSYPKDFLKKYTSATIDVVEIDPMLTELAKQHFNLPNSDRLTIYHEDGRTFLNQTENRYDIFFGDAFKSLYSVPYQLTTIEAVNKISNILNDDGVALINIASAIEGDGGQFLRAEYKTFKSVFPQVFIFPVQYPKNGQATQNLMMVALKSEVKPIFSNDDQNLNIYLSHLWKKNITDDMPLLTDDHAPVDHYINKAIQ